MDITKTETCDSKIEVNNDGCQSRSVTQPEFQLELVDTGTKRYVEIIQVVGTHQSKIIVSMKHMLKFIENIIVVLPYADVYSEKRKSEHDTGNHSYLYKQEFTPAEGIKYVFELFNTGADSFLGIKCFKNAKVYQILIPSDKFYSFLEGCISFSREYPEIDLRDVIAERRSSYPRGRGSLGEYRSTDRRVFSNMSEQTERQPRKPLKVIDAILPRRLDSGEKSFIFEIIKGDKEFLRVKELIRDNVKETIHIPLKDAELFSKVIIEITSEHAELSKQKQ